jgi:hypothetical protein
VRRNDAVQVRARNNAERTIGKRAVVQMHTDGNHALEQRRRRLDEQSALLHRPPAELGVRDAACNWNTEILMDGNEPVERR